MKNKLIFSTCILLTLKVNGMTTGSLFFNKIYEAGTGKSITAGSEWKAFSINGEKTKIAFTEDQALSIKTGENSAFVYMVPAENIGISALPCTMETAIRIPDENAGMDMDIRTPAGERLSVKIRKSGLVDRRTNDTVYFGPDHSRFSTFRFAFDDKKTAKIYKNGQLLLTAECVNEDEIKNPDFEKSHTLDPMWWCSDWSQLTIDGNNPHTGNKSLHWENGWTGQLGAKIPVQPNAKYRLTYWAKAVRINAGQTAMKGALWINGENKGSLDIPVGDYRKFSIDFNTANFDEIAEIIFHNGWNDSDAGAFAIYIDDLELTRLENSPYIQFGKINPSEKGEFILNYIAVKTGEELSPVLYPDLAETISQAKALKSEATAGTQPGNYPVYAIDRLTEKLEMADTLAGDSEYMLIDASYAHLEREINRFGKCRITDSAFEFATLEITPAITKLKLTEQIRINASGIMSNGQTIDPEILYMTYYSMNNKITVDETGLITAIDTGIDKIIITAQYINALKTIELPIEITPYEIISVEASPYRSVIELGDATGIQATAFMTGNEEADETRIRFSYQSLSPGIAEINDYGTIIAKAPGTAEVRVTGHFENKTVSAVFNIKIITAARIEIDIPAEIKVGETHTYTIKAYYSDGSQATPEEGDILVHSKDRNTLRVDNQGMLEAIGEGKAIFSVRFRQGGTEIVRPETLQISSPQQLYSQNPDPLFRFYPNPASDRVFIDCPADTELSEIRILSLTGKIISRYLVSETNRKELNVCHLSPGVYFITLTGKNLEIVRKLIKL